MPASPFDLSVLKEIVVARFPELSGGSFRLLAEGWDSVALDVDDRLIFKFPRHVRGEAALRREAAILGLVRSAVDMRVPSLSLFEEPQLFSRHEKIPGGHLITVQYEGLEDNEKAALGKALGQFYAQLHTIAPVDALARGAEPIEVWRDGDEILRRIRPVLPERMWTFAEAAMARWADLPVDPLGTTYGFFDGHGWNMAFDHEAGKLNGVYDFADSGIGPLHQEFIYSSLISADLTERIIAQYEDRTGRHVDRERVDLLTATHRLWELAMEAHIPGHVDALVRTVELWADRP